MAVTAAAVAREKAKLLQRFQEQEAPSAAAAAEDRGGAELIEQLREK